MLPVFLAGFPFEVFVVVQYARSFAETGHIASQTSALISLITWVLHPLIAWQNLTGWSVMNSSILALSLFPWWWAVRRLFDVRVAWISTIIMSLMPMYWREAVILSGYPLAFFFLFLTFAVFLELQRQNRALAVFFAGICFGLTLAANHAFLTFLPWFVGAYLWQHRATWKRALLECGLFCITAYIAMMLPLFPNALAPDLSFRERIGVFLPSSEDQLTGKGHLYPDYYAYQFLRKEFDEILTKQIKESPFLARQQDENMLLIFGVGDLNFFDSMQNGIWGFLNSIPLLFLQETMGGMFLWLFILPGIILLFRERKQLLFFLAGLWLCMEFLLRFVLHYSRDHTMDIGWMLTLFAAIGIVQIGKKLATKRLTSLLLSIFMVLMVSGQLVQANRKLFAQLYAKSTVPESYAAAAALQEIPANAVVANPRKADLFYFSDRKNVVLHYPTIDYLAEQGRLKEPFEYYGVTHILGYDDEHAALITKTLPDIKAVDITEHPVSVPLTPFIRFLLHLIR